MEPQQLGSLVERRQAKPANVPISRPSTNSLPATTREEFVRSMAVLCALKRTAEFQASELKAWHAVLGGFPATTVNRAVLKLVASETRFPEVADLWQECRRIEKKSGRLVEPYNPNGGTVERTLTEPELVEIAQRIGLEV